MTTLRPLVSNAEKIFSRTFEQFTRYSLRLQGIKRYKTTNTVDFASLIYGSPENKIYVMHMKFHKIDKWVKFKCSCPAYRFFCRYAMWRNGALFGTPDRWARTPAKKKNPRAIPCFCKHGLALAYTLLNMGEIEGK